MPPRLMNAESPRDDHYIARLNWGLLLLSMVGLLTACILVFCLLFLYNTTPLIFSDDDGYIENRNIMSFTLDENRIKAFLNLVLPRLLGSTPGVYDIDDLAPLLDPRVINGFTEIFRSSIALRTRFSERRWYELSEIRRFSTPDPDQLVAIVKGQLSIYRGAKDAMDSSATGVFSQTASVRSGLLTHLVYFDTDAPSADNPWGLIVTSVVELNKPDIANKYWEDSKPFSQTAFNGAILQKFQRDSLPKTTQTRPRKNGMLIAPSNP
jgi:hypothetical protein